MQRNLDIQNIQEWVADWSGTSVDESPYSWEDIRSICRGPMREVLLSFLVPRFRTDDQIKVIRSNLFLNDVINKDNTPTGQLPPNHFEKEIKDIKEKLTKLHEGKVKRVNEIEKATKMVDGSKTTALQNMADLMSNFKQTESRAKHIKDRVKSTNRLLQELYTATPASNTSSSEKLETVAEIQTNAETKSIGSPSTTLQSSQPQLKALYNNAFDLFDLNLLPSPNANHSQVSLLSEIQALTTTVYSQISDLAQSGIPPISIEKWAKTDQDASTKQVRNMSDKFSNVMNPLEELQNETDALYTKLMTAQLDIHFSNRDLKSKIRECETINDEKFRNAVIQGNVVPSDLKCQMQKEQHLKKLKRCRELAKTLNDLDYLAQCNETEELLTALCGSPLTIEKRINSRSTERSFRASLGTTDGNGSFNLAKQETLEDITCGLFKSFPSSRNQLESTIEQCKNLVLEKFPKILTNEKTEKHKKFQNIPFETGICTMSFEGIKIPKEFVPNHDLLTQSKTSGQEDDLLGEIFRIKNEIESKRAQYDRLVQKREARVNEKSLLS